MQVQMLRPGLWRWTTDHPEWTPESVNWGPAVGCVYLETPEAIVLVDPLVPVDPGDRERFWGALDQDVERLGLPVVVVTTIALHERSAGDVVERYGASRWTPGESSPTGLTIIPAATNKEVVVLATAHGALITADLLIGDRAGGIRLCPASWLTDPVTLDDVRAELQVLLSHDIQMILPSHGEPILEGAAQALRAALS
jgi:hypothetical protein